MTNEKRTFATELPHLTEANPNGGWRCFLDSRGGIVYRTTLANAKEFAWRLPHGDSLSDNTSSVTVCKEGALYFNGTKLFAIVDFH